VRESHRSASYNCLFILIRVADYFELLTARLFVDEQFPHGPRIAWLKLSVDSFPHFEPMHRNIDWNLKTQSHLCAPYFEDRDD
jgi:hypothetical protein